MSTRAASIARWSNTPLLSDYAIPRRRFPPTREERTGKVGRVTPCAPARIPPRPMRNEWGEGQGEGEGKVKSTPSSAQHQGLSTARRLRFRYGYCFPIKTTSSPQPSPPSFLWRRGSKPRSLSTKNFVSRPLPSEDRTLDCHNPPPLVRWWPSGRRGGSMTEYGLAKVGINPSARSKLDW